MEDGYELYRSMELWSDELRLHGYADAVELHSGVPVPIEHKRTGRHDADRQQLCAQALCLEEMYEASVDHGYLVDRTRHRRVRVSFDGKLRARTLQTIAELHAMLAEAVLPPPATDARCRNCSLIHSCLPQLTTGTKR